MSVTTASGILRGQRVAFTGKLASMTRTAAHALVRQSGAIPVAHLSRRTSILVVGMDGWPLLPDGRISQKLSRAEQLVAEGCALEIISEEEFLERAGRRSPRSMTRKSYAADVLCQIAGISREQLRRWEALGLIRSSEHRYDFQDLTSLRVITELVGQGVRPETIGKSLRGLASVLPDMDRPLSQLKIVVENRENLLVELDQMRLSPDGQLSLDFDARPTDEPRVLAMRETEQSAEQLLEYGLAFEEAEQFDRAADAYREAIAKQPLFPEAFFNLGNVLRALGKADAAEEQYRIALSHEPSLAPAWYNLADLQEEHGRIRDAVESLKNAISSDPGYADAYFNLAVCFEKLGQDRDAELRWREYLKLDIDSEWASVARKRLANRVMGD